MKIIENPNVIMEQSELEKVYGVYGTSSKRAANEFVGAFVISEDAFANVK